MGGNAAMAEKVSARETLVRAERLLDAEPAAALRAVEAVLEHDAALAPAEFIACRALRRLGRAGEALPRLAALARRRGAPPEVLWELAQAASEGGDHRQAVAALEALTRQQPLIAAGWALLARELRHLGQEREAWRADLAGVHAASRHPELIEAAMAMNEGRLDDSAATLSARLERLPADAAGLRLMGEVRWRQGDMGAALDLVERAVAAAPGFDLARNFLVRLLLQSNRLSEALEQAELLQASPVLSPAHDLLKASVLVRLGDQAGALAIYQQLLAQEPGQPQVWKNLGHVLKTLGRQAEAVQAYREAVARQPTLGEAWWSLANLKTVKLDGDDIAAMEQALRLLAAEGEAEGGEDVFHLHFSLGKAFEDAGDDAAAIHHYRHGNRLRRLQIDYDPDAFAAEVAASAATCSAAFLTRAGDGGCPAPDPIFVVGLPRAGSTLVEQILASHSLVEGTMELPDMMMIAARLQSRVDEGEFADLSAALSSLTPLDRRRLGEEYLDRTRIHRQTGKPHFVDKMPNNWQHVGLIRLILPNARIVDARRHPMGCCFSGWKQHFARGQAFTYDLAEIGRYYRDYVALMASFDEAGPGAVHRVVYERMVADTRGEVSRLLAALHLPFEESCLTFWENRRAVRTASSEQVRQPIFADGVDHWRRFEPWLSPLVDALGPVLDAYPDVPAGLRISSPGNGARPSST